MFFVYLLSGLFLGWSLGANDAANVYGTAVGTRMMKFRTAAIACSLFVLVGAVVGGAGASHTLGKLGAVNALPGSFTVALAAGLTVAWMTRLKLPVSTSQAVVGAIIGWNFFAGATTDYGSLTKIVSSWVLCPVLAAVFAALLYKLVQVILKFAHVHLFQMDVMTRYGLFVVGAFASYSLGANNIANVMGVFVPSAPFDHLDVFGLFRLSAGQQLFFLGAIAIGVGVFTYSKRVMLTVGSDLFRLSPMAALIVVLAQAIVLFLFSSEPLENWLIRHGLPPIPLVPVSSSQAVIGAVIGIGLLKGGRNIQYRVLGRIASGWVSTPVLAGVMSFVLLFVVQNVFSQRVHEAVVHRISPEVVVELKQRGLYDEGLEELVDRRFEGALALQRAVSDRVAGATDAKVVVELARVQLMVVDIERLKPFWDYEWYSEEQMTAVFRLHGRRFDHGWQLDAALAGLSDEWRSRPKTRQNRLYNKKLAEKRAHLHSLLSSPPPESRKLPGG
ncbi:MAG: anion permease [Deltaproteobacteria bacterium]|jgi:PiT family inorganic phosphate transporter|nr:anion permease [Deltaproteobacteria bacterium]MBW2536662.1 anion permease [Deltaproteobacteria bacterium]